LLLLVLVLWVWVSRVGGTVGRISTRCIRPRDRRRAEPRLLIVRAERTGRRDAISAILRRREIAILRVGNAILGVLAMTMVASTWTSAIHRRRCSGRRGYLV
jgi:hypothetical protein